MTSLPEPQEHDISDFGVALSNAALFLQNASEIAENVGEKDANTLALIGNGWASLALALSQDRTASEIAELVVHWLVSPSGEGFDKIVQKASAWAGFPAPETMHSESEEQESDQETFETDRTDQA